MVDSSSSSVKPASRRKPPRTQLVSKLFVKASQAKTTGNWPRAIELARKVLKVDAFTNRLILGARHWTEAYEMLVGGQWRGAASFEFSMSKVSSVSGPGRIWNEPVMPVRSWSCVRRP